MVFVQDWPGATNNTAATAKTQTGEPTTPGSTLFLDVYVRDSATHPAVTVTDNGATSANVWELLAEVDNGSTNLYMYLCRSTEPITSVTATWGTSLLSIIYLAEFSDVGDLIAATPLVGEGTPTPTALTEGALLRGVLGVNVSDRTFELVATGVPAPTLRNGWRGSQMEVQRADAYATTAGDGSIGWNRTAGALTSAGVINAAFSATAAPPPPPPPAPLLHRVDATGTTPIRLGIVTATGVDTGT